MLIMATFIIGGCLGFILAALVMVIPKDEEEIKRDWIEYKCKVNQASGCSDNCCRECEKYNECSLKCEGHPEECGQAYIKLR